jgi:DNA-binding CsgD family transcriptional regulator
MPATSALLERDRELAVIERLLRAAGDGTGGLLTIEAEAGAGKTALLDGAAKLGEEAGLRVLRARGGEFERDFAYGVVRQLFEPLLAEASLREELLGGGAAAAAAIFDPVGAPTQGVDPLSIQHGLYCLVQALVGSSPLLVLIDDAQWADLATLRALAYVGRRLGGLDAGLALAVRTGEPGEHEPLLDELRREPGAVTIGPAPLSATAVGNLIAAESGTAAEDGLAAAARDATGGNPFLLIELLRALDLEQLDGERVDADRLARLAGSGASRAILTRLNRLGEDAAVAARAVAVLEPNAGAQRITALSGLAAESVAGACERLVVARLLADAQPVAFVHPLVRAAVLSEIPAPRLAADHARAARLLSIDGAAADAVVAHLLLTEPADDPWSVAELRSAATEALGRGAPVAAVSYLRRALREPPPKPDRLAVSRELGAALLRADEPEGIDVLRTVRGALDDPLERAAIAAELSVSFAFRHPGGSEGVALLEASLAEIGSGNPDLARFLRGQLLIHLVSGLEEIPAGVRPEREAWPDGENRSGRFLLRQLSYLYAIGFGRIEDALELATKAGVDPDLYAEDVRAGFPSHYAWGAMTLADRGDLIAAPLAISIEASKQRGAPASVAAAYGVRAYCGFLDGDVKAAEADVGVALRVMRSSEFPVMLGAWTSTAVVIAIERGELNAAQELLDDVWRRRALGPGLPGTFLLFARGQLRASSGRHAEARHDFIAAGERVGWLPYANPELLGWRTGLALAEGALGNEEEAQRLAAEAVRLAREAGGQRGTGITLRVQGTVIRGEEGIELLREARDELAGTRARLEYAKALVELGAALRRANRRREAREPLRGGLDLAHRCGATALEERARTELIATGARPRKAVLSGVEALTPSELRVARMAVEGMTNRQIAQSLFVTPKTVETHLRHVYQKLEVAGRTDLAGVLA